MIEVEDVKKRESSKLGQENKTQFEENKTPPRFVKDAIDDEWPSIDVYIADRLEVITNLIKKVATREDMEKSKNEIISHQEKEIGEAKELIKDLIRELESKSFANIILWISIVTILLASIGLVFSIAGGHIILLPIHFIIGASFCGLIIFMAVLAKNIYK